MRVIPFLLMLNFSCISSAHNIVHVRSNRGRGNLQTSAATPQDKQKKKKNIIAMKTKTSKEYISQEQFN